MPHYVQFISIINDQPEIGLKIVEDVLASIKNRLENSVLRDIYIEKLQVEGDQYTTFNIHFYLIPIKSRNE